ncbi:unnamed protein product [Discosporangium mesarthrocarpum]
MKKNKFKLNSNILETKRLKAKSWSFKLSHGRNNTGRITSWQKGGGHLRSYRQVDFIRKSTQGIVLGLEYDPNRSAFLGRIYNPDTKTQHYILAPNQLKTGEVIRSKSDQGINGHSQTLRHITTGSIIHNLSFHPNGCGQVLRAPGAFGQVLQKKQNLAQIKLKSGQYKWFNLETIASLGMVSNPNHHLKKLRKAGQSRWLGRRPSVRGVAMNPIDHPHGGGEGKTSGGRPSVTPWGKPTKGKPSGHNYSIIK